ncbi:hypothetical protein BN2475_480074 [Paraburkholderia ribeironis]|uniref:Uncharacterized protein n=1 Tax=Paraburkholderia ribeironis TaxID=1247936 RepID=A0A1N7SBF7_9BURK|nr:hypothetical protein BN2475_480074 [Paraburkholderia ribeironis]
MRCRARVRLRCGSPRPQPCPPSLALLPALARVGGLQVSGIEGEDGLRWVLHPLVSLVVSCR